MWSVFSFLAKFRTLARKKRTLANPTKGFLEFLRKKSPYLEEKKLKVAIFRQCPPVGRQD
jgi:hypothetical protein